MISNRSGDDENNVVDIAEMSSIIDDGTDAKVVALYDVLKEILVAPAEPSQPMAPIRYYDLIHSMNKKPKICMPTT